MLPDDKPVIYYLCNNLFFPGVSSGTANDLYLSQ